MYGNSHINELVIVLYLCIFPVSTDLCMSTEMSTTSLMNCILVNLHGFLDVLDNWNLPVQPYWHINHLVNVRFLPGSGFLLCTFILMISCFFTSTVFSTLAILWLTSQGGLFSLRGDLDDLRLLNLHCVDDVFAHSLDLSLGRFCLVFLRVFCDASLPLCRRLAGPVRSKLVQ